MTTSHRAVFAAANLLVDSRDYPGAAFMLRLEEGNLREDAARGFEALGALILREYEDSTELPPDLVALYEKYSPLLGFHSELVETCLKPEASGSGHDRE
jgi:hypothetical protein